MPKLENIRFELKIKEFESISEVKQKLSRIRQLTNELDKELDSILGLEFELKPKT